MAKKLDLTKPVQTKGGKPVRIICTDSGPGAVGDLENIPEKHTAWVALHRLPNGEVVPAGLYESQEEAELADTKLGTSFVVAIKLEWED